MTESLVRWADNDTEIVRILGIDTPEIRRLEHNLPYDQPFGLEAKAFTQGAFAAATDVEIIRSPTLDPYGRTLAYLFVNGATFRYWSSRPDIAVRRLATTATMACPRRPPRSWRLPRRPLRPPCHSSRRTCTGPGCAP